jgi:hypothetical protein
MSDLENVAVGDMVCMVITHGYRRLIVGLHTGKVEKIKGTQIAALGTRWNKVTGREIGGSSWTPTYLQILTDDLQQEAERGRKTLEVEKTLSRVSAILLKAEGDEAVRWAEVLPQELIEAAKAPGEAWK